MRFAIWPGPQRPWSETLELVRHAEATGWDSAYYCDHFMPDTDDGSPSDGDTYECLSVLAGLAAATDRIRLGTLVCSMTYRHPAVLAKMATAIDHISSGRLLLGVGAGWQQNEHTAYGLELGSVRERVDRFAEGVNVLRSLLDGGRTSLQGEYYQLVDAPCRPGPVKDRLPLLVGCKSPRMMRITATVAEEWNMWATPELIAEKGAEVDRACEAIGRDPATLAHSTQALLFLSDDAEFVARIRATVTTRPLIAGGEAEVTDTVAAYAAAGVDELILPDFTMAELSRAKDTYDRFLSEVVPGIP